MESCATHSDILTALGLKSSGSNHQRLKKRLSQDNLQLKSEKYMGQISRIPQNELWRLVTESESYSDALRQLGLKNNSGNYRSLKIHMEKNNLSPSDFKKVFKGGKRPLDLKEILVKNSHYSRGHLKRRLIKVGLLDEVCYVCGAGPEWNGLLLTLQLDHINGDPTDNRLCNLRILCPNCHSQTLTYARNHNPAYTQKFKPQNCCTDCGVALALRVSVRCRRCRDKLQVQELKHPLDEILGNIRSYGYVHTARIYGVSDNTIRKWLSKVGLDPKDFRKIKIEAKPK